MKLWICCFLVMCCLPARIACYCLGNDFAIVTGATASDFPSLENLAGSIHVWSPSFDLEVYDFGLTEEQRRTVDSWNSTKLLNVKHLVETSNSHLHLLWTHAYKPIVIAESLERHKCALWLDSGVELRQNADIIVDTLDNEGFWFVWGGYEFNENSFLTSMSQVEFDFNSASSHPDFKWIISTSQIGFSREHPTYNEVLVPWRDCAFNCDCISPSSSTSYFLQDQTVLNQFIYSPGGFEEQFKKEHSSSTFVHTEEKYWINSQTQNWNSKLTRNELQQNDIVIFTRRHQPPYVYSKHVKTSPKEPNLEAIFWNSTVIPWENPREVYPPPILLKKYDVIICAVFANEGPYLQEWVEYHKMAGVGHMYLYEALSSPDDNWRDILYPYIQEGLVTVSRQYQYFSVQGATYEHCLSEHASEANWIMFIDIDEYVVAKEPYNSLPEVLAEFSEHTALVLPWKTLCSSGHLESTPAGLSTANYDKFIPCANLTSCDQLSLEVKLILNAAKAPLHRCIIANAEGFFHNCLGDDVITYVQFNLLAPTYKPFATALADTGMSAVDEQFREVWSNFKLRHEDFILPSYDKIQLNHYHVRSCPEWKRRCNWKREWIQRHFADKSKVERLPFARRRINENYCHEIEPKCIGVDDSMKRYVSELERIIEHKNTIQIFTPNRTEEDLQVNSMNQQRQLDYLAEYYNPGLASSLAYVWNEFKTRSLETVLAFHVDIYSPFLLSASRNFTLHFFAYKNVSQDVYLPIYAQAMLGILHKSLKNSTSYDAIVVEYEEMLKPSFNAIADITLSEKGMHIIVFSANSVNCSKIVSVLVQNMFHAEVINCAMNAATLFVDKRQSYAYSTTQYPVWKSHKGKIWLYDQVFNMRGSYYWGMEAHSYAFHGLWESTIGDIVRAVKALKLNVIRMPVSPMLPLQDVSPRLQTKEWWGMQFDFVRKTSMQIVDFVIDKLAAEGIMVMLELHTEPTTSWHTVKFSEDDILKAWDILLDKFETKWNLMGISIVDFETTSTWGTGSSSDWSASATKLISAIAQDHPSFTGLFIITPPNCFPWTCSAAFLDFGSEELNQRLVYSLPVAGPDNPKIHLDEFDDPKFPENLPDRWDYFFEFRKKINQSVIIGEWGGNFLPDTKDRLWETAFVEYLIKNDLQDNVYWNLHPEQGGLFQNGWIKGNPDKQAILDQLQPEPTQVTFNDETGVAVFTYTASKATYRASVRADPVVEIPTNETVNKLNDTKLATATESVKSQTTTTEQTPNTNAQQEPVFKSRKMESFGDMDDLDLEDEVTFGLGFGYESEAMSVLSEVVDGIMFLEKQKLRYNYLLQLQRLQMLSGLELDEESLEEEEGEGLEWNVPQIKHWRRPRFNYEDIVEF